jgi:DNA invertase Pin-like site-specific DNA recombinase
VKLFAYFYFDPLLQSSPKPDLQGWEVEHTYQDWAGESFLPKESPRITHRNTSGDSRSQWQQLLQDCENTPPDGVLLRGLEDLGDSLPEVRDRLAQLEALHIPLFLIDSPPTPCPLLPSDLLPLLHHLRQEQQSHRIRRGHARNRIKAQPPPGKAPYGYRRGKTRYVLDRSTAPIVKDFFEQFLLYGSLRGAVRYLAKKYGKKIAVSTGQRWLTNPVYRGDLEYQDGKVVPDTHEAILSRDEAAQVDRLLRRNRRLPPRTASAPRSLAGLVVCGECQLPLTITRVTTVRKDREYLYLRPSRCPKKPKCSSIPYEEVLQKTIARICEDLPRAVAGTPLPDMDRVKQDMETAIAAKQTILDQLPALIESGILDRETAELRAYRVRTETAELQAQLAQLPPVNLQAIAQTVSIPQFWLDLSETERRFYFREFIRQVELTRQGGEWAVRLIFIF